MCTIFSSLQSAARWNSENWKISMTICSTIWIQVFSGICFELCVYCNKCETFSTILSCNRCEICLKVFPRKADLSAHMSQHKAVDMKRFRCDECGKVWKSKYRLDVHKRSHEEKIARTFPCNYCNRKFVKYILFCEEEKMQSKSIKCSLCIFLCYLDFQRKNCSNHIYIVFTKQIKTRKRRSVNIVLKRLQRVRRCCRIFEVCIWRIRFDVKKYNVKFVVLGWVIGIR